MDNPKKPLLQSLPGVDRMLQDVRIQALVEHHPRALIVDAIRDF